MSKSPRGGLRPPQFRLSTMMVLTALLGVMFSLSGILGPYGTFWLVIFVLAVFAHVAGNALGTKLRDAGSEPDASDRAVDQDPFRRPEESEYAPATKLSQRASLGLPILLAALTGVVVGGVLGGVWVSTTMWQHATVPNVATAVFAFGVLGGIWTFLTVGFVQVTLGAIFHAVRSK